MREAVCFSVVLKSIWVGELAQLRKKWHNCETKMYNCKKNGTTAKLYVGIIQEISTTAKHIYCSCTFFGNNHFSLSLHLIPCPTPCHPATAAKEAMVGTYLPYPAEPPQP